MLLMVYLSENSYHLLRDCLVRESCFSLFLRSASSDIQVQIPEMHMWEHINTVASHKHTALQASTEAQAA